MGMRRVCALVLTFLCFANGVAIADIAPSSSPSPSVAQQSGSGPDVTDEDDPTSRVRTVTLQGTFSGASYGPGNYSASQVIPRLATLYVGKALLRLSLPRLQTINGVASGLSDTQLFYLFQHQERSGAAFVGVFAQFPTATNPLFGTGKWLIGPAAAYVFAYKPRAVIAGILLQSGFSFAGAANRPNQSAITVLPFGSLRLQHGWYLKLPEAPWIFDLQRGASIIPLGVGFGKVTTWNTYPMLVALSDEVTVLRANVVNAPKNTVRLTFTVLLLDQGNR